MLVSAQDLIFRSWRKQNIIGPVTSTNAGRILREREEMPAPQGAGKVFRSSRAHEAQVGPSDNRCVKPLLPLHGPGFFFGPRELLRFAGEDNSRQVKTRASDPSSRSTYRRMSGA